MSTVICAPQLTMRHPEIAEEFYQQCKTLLEEYVVDVKCILSYDLLNQMPLPLAIFYFEHPYIFQSVPTMLHHSIHLRR